MLKVNDVIVVVRERKYYLVIDRPYEGNKNYLLKEITLDEAMSHKDYRLNFNGLPEHYVIQK